MAAGLPGVGLSGIFFIISALVAVPLEVIRTLRGQSSFARWANVSRHCVLAVLMIGALELFYTALRLAFSKVSHVLPSLTHGILVQHTAASGVQVHSIPLLPVATTIGLVALVMGLAKGAELVARVSRRQRYQRN
jgi:hypothetical protein